MTRQSVHDAVVATLGEMLRLSVEQIDNTSDLARDLGVDSLMLTHLLLAVEERVGARVPSGSESHLAGVRTVEDLTLRFWEALGSPRA